MHANAVNIIVRAVVTPCKGHLPHICFEGRVCGNITVGIDGGVRRGGSPEDVIGNLVGDYLRQGKRPLIESVQWDTDGDTQQYAQSQSSVEQNPILDVFPRKAL